VILGFLAIERPGHAAMMVLGQRHGRGGRERNALVGGPEQHVELEAGARERGRVTLAEHRDGLAVVEQPALKKYGLSRPDLSLNVPKRNAWRDIASSMKVLWYSCTGAVSV
jgi:hypothetical protein